MYNEKTLAFSAQDIVNGTGPYKCGQTLIGHTSEETAYIISDYPYGRLRTYMKVWIETRPNMGMRSMMQTQNPKSMRWNKPKASTYSDILCLTFDDIGHIAHHGFSMAYSDEKHAQAFLDRFETVLQPGDIAKLRLKIDYARAMERAESSANEPLTYGTKPYWEAHRASMKFAMESSGMMEKLIEEVKVNPNMGIDRIVIPNEVKPDRQNTDIEF